MNWRNVVGAIGVVLTIGAGVRYTVLAPAVSLPVLLDAGIANDCPAEIINCPAYLSDDAIARMLDAGQLLDRPTEHYVDVETLTFDCSDAGLPLENPVVIPGLTYFGVSQAGDPHLQVLGRNREFCTFKPCDALCSSPKPWRIVHSGLPCARAPMDGGICLKLGDYIGPGNIFPVGEASGPSCELVSAGCGAIGITGGREGEL